MSQLMCRYAGRGPPLPAQGAEGPGRRRGAGPGVRRPLPPRRLPPRRPEPRPVPRLREARRPEPDEGLLSPPRRDGTVPIVPGLSEPSALDDGLEQFDRQFLLSWRTDLLDRAWNGLDELERGPASRITRSSACGLTTRDSRRMIGRPASPSGSAPGHPRRLPSGAAARPPRVRRPPDRRGPRSLEKPTAQTLEQELADLELLEYCRPYLKSRN